MFKSKEIIVVAPKEYKDVARKLSHEASKLPGCKGAFWDISRYEANEFQLGDDRYVVFVGGPQENHLTKEFLPLISKLENNSGACFGYDGSKAVVFGEGDLAQKKDFMQVVSETAIMVSGVGVGAGTGAILGATIFSTFLPITAPAFALSAFFYYLFCSSSGKEKKLRHDQTNVALSLFLSTQFDEWTNPEKVG